MANIKNFQKFNESKSSSYKLSEDEVSYLWSKIEFLKKKKATDSKNDLYELLNSGKTSFTEDEFIKILNSLEYSFKKKLKEGELKTEKGISIHSKLPEDWLGVKFSVIKAKEEREEKAKEKEKSKEKKKGEK